VLPEVLCEKAAQYAAAKAHVSNPLYVKMASNWLRDECWLEDPQPPRPKAPRPELGHSTARNGTGKRASKAARRGKEKAVRAAVKAELQAEQQEKELARLARIKASRAHTLAAMPARREKQRVANVAKSLATREAGKINPTARQIGGAAAPAGAVSSAPERQLPAPVPPPPATPAAALDDLDVYRRALGMMA
jgi:hypothetical protein